MIRLRTSKLTLSIAPSGGLSGQILTHWFFLDHLSNGNRSKSLAQALLTALAQRVHPIDLQLQLRACAA